MVQFPFLAPLAEDRRTALLAGLPRLRYEDGAIILERGEDSTDVYFIMEGATRSVNYGPDGQMAYFRLRKAGDFFGYYSALTGKPRTANMIAVGDTLLGKMPGKDFMDLVTHNPDLSRYMLQLVTNILREETDRLTHIITLNAEQLVCADLLTLVHAENSLTLTIPARNEFAARLGLTRETLSRILNKLAKDGLIELDKDTLTVCAPERLQNII